MIPSPGAGQRIGGVTSRYIEFTVPSDADVARMSVLATPNLPADVDLHLQRRLEVESARLLVGSRYRIVSDPEVPLTRLSLHVPELPERKEGVKGRGQVLRYDTMFDCKT